MAKITLGNATFEVPPQPVIDAVLQRMIGPDGRGGYRPMNINDIATYGRLKNVPGTGGDFKGTYHQGRELLPLP